MTQNQKNHLGYPDGFLLRIIKLTLFDYLFLQQITNFC
jgi:hypothetical protein